MTTLELPTSLLWVIACIFIIHAISDFYKSYLDYKLKRFISATNHKRLWRHHKRLKRYVLNLRDAIDNGEIPYGDETKANTHYRTLMSFVEESCDDGTDV